MVRRLPALAPLAIVAIGGVAACNALTGAGDLRIDDCPGCDSEAGMVADGGLDARGDAFAEGGPFDGADLPPRAGSLDPTFGTKGVTTSGLLDTVTSVAVRADGKIVVAGASGGQLAVARFSATGAIDPTFGGNGRIIVPSSTSSRADAVAIDGKGRIVAAGTSTTVDATAMTTTQFAYVVRIGDAALDTTFAGSGKRVFMTAGEAITSIVIAPGTNELFLGGRAPGLAAGDPEVGAIWHVQENGTFFNPGRAEVTYVAGGASTIAALSPGAADLVAVGASTAGMEADFGVTRFLATGVDPAFAGDGTATFAVGSGVDKAVAVARLSNGTLVVGGETEVASMFGLPTRSPQLGLVAVQSSGAIATTWGNKGKTVVKSDQFTLFQNAGDFLRAILVDSSDRVLAIGYSDDKLQPSVHKIRGIVARLGANGRSDLTFGQGGSVSFAFEPKVDDTQVAGAAAQADGKIVVAGTSSGQLGLARLIP